MAVFDIPSTETKECSFVLLDGTVSTPLGKSPGFNVTQIFDPIWKVTVQTNHLDRARRQAWSAWKDSLRGRLNRLRMYDIARSQPLAYPDATQPSGISSGWNGLASVTSVGASGALGLSGLPAGYVLSTGDRVGLEQSSRYGYYTVISGGTANGSGALTVTVAPLLHTAYFTTSAVARIWRPVALFILDPESWSLPETFDVYSQASFEAYQVLI